ncbi:MAG: UDP-N-acetylglucosamine--N-acetylmuramyl-(pentapeptide) pyrophosphoryl-undecaprenol N-acetylglucosamine transferase [Chloroflexota bacterium]
MRLLICAGGTGGGVYPALAVLEQLKVEGQRLKDENLQPETWNLELLWVGGEGGMEEALVKRAGVPFTAIPAAGVHGVGLRALPRNLTLLARGVFASRRILREFRPDVLFFTGGYVAAPMAVAGRRVPTLLYVPDIEPGLALKTLARFADRITVTSIDSKAFFPRNARIIETGYPTRPELARWDRKSAREKLGLDEKQPVLLVFGGSKGARSINMAVLAHLPALLKLAQVVHVSGELDWPTVESARASLTEEQAIRYHAFPYLHEEMGAALACADLAVSRAGASSLGELPLFGLPAVLVPYPHAWRYQKVNAESLVKHGAAVLLEDARLQTELLAVVESLLTNGTRLGSMRAAMRTLARPQAAADIARQLAEMAGESS